MYRIIDFKRDMTGVQGTLERVEYDPNRTARIALVKYPAGTSQIFKMHSSKFLSLSWPASDQQLHLFGILIVYPHPSLGGHQPPTI